MTEKNKQKLIDKVLEQIKKDVAVGDLTAIDELLKSCPDKNLKAFISEFEYEKLFEKIIGYQVVGTEGTDKEGQIHPEMEASFCIYSLKQAEKMIENNITENWCLLPIKTDDIEDATIMFKGNPNK